MVINILSKVNLNAKINLKGVQIKKEGKDKSEIISGRFEL